MRAGLIAITIGGLMLGPALAQAARTPPTPSTAPKLAPGTPIPPAELEPFVDGIVRAAMARDHLAGVTVAIVQDGAVVLKKGYGFAGPGRPVNPDRTLFRVGSVSKTFTWIAAMQEIEAGRMHIDKPMNDYLPADVAIPSVQGWRAVTVRDVMSHTPGFEERMLDHMFAETPAQILPLAAKLKLNPPKRVFPPGIVPAYSNFGVMLMGEAIAHLNGASFQDAIERKITAPLGMDHTSFREPYPARADLPAPLSPTLAAEVATAYHWTGIELKAEPYEWISQAGPAGAASSTAGDMTRYLLMMLGDGEWNGTRIYSPATALAFRTPIKVPVPDGGQVDHGFLQTQLPGGFMGYGHDGDTMWFHSDLMTIPALKLGIFLSTNTDTGQHLTNELPRLIVGHFYAAAPGLPRRGSPTLAADRAMYEGTYITNRRPFSGLEKFLYLLINQSSIEVTSDGYLTTRGGGEPETWTPIGRPGHFQAVDGPQTMDFAMRNGKAVRWFMPGETISLDRVGPLYQRNVLLALVLLASLTAVVTLIAASIRPRGPATNLQRRLTGAQCLAAGAWLIALGACIVFAGGAENLVDLVFSWPGTALVTASSAALFASALSAVVLVALPFAWMGDNGWGPWRKLWFSATSVVFFVLGAQLAFWGFLEPWAA